MIFIRQLNHRRLPVFKRGNGIVTDGDHHFAFFIYPAPFAVLFDPNPVLFFFEVAYFFVVAGEEYAKIGSVEAEAAVLFEQENSER